MEAFIKVHNLLWQLLWKLSEHFFKTWEAAKNTKYTEKGNLSSDEKILAIFSRIIENDKSGTYKSLL